MQPFRIAPSTVILDVVEQHADEAAFLWLLRDRAVDAPHYAQRRLASLDKRIEAHLEGLRVAGEIGLDLTLNRFNEHQEIGELFAAAVLVLESAEPARLAPLVEFAGRVPQVRRGLFGAIGWVKLAVLGSWVRIWLDSADPFERLLGLVSCSLHRLDPKARLARYLADSDLTVRARAYRLAGELGRVDLRHLVADAVPSESELAQSWAAWSALLLGHQAGLPLLVAISESDGLLSGPAVEVVARRAAPDEIRDWIRQLNADTSRRRLAVRAAGILGDPAAVPWLIDTMLEPTLARIAGESLALIAGVDLAYENLSGTCPEGFHTGPSDDLLDTNVSLDQDNDLQWPDPAALTTWWQTSGAGFVTGTRYLLGHAIDDKACECAWVAGFQRQRRAAAYELAMTYPNLGLRAWRASTICDPAKRST